MSLTMAITTLDSLNGSLNALLSTLSTQSGASRPSLLQLPETASQNTGTSAATVANSGGTLSAQSGSQAAATISPSALAPVVNSVQSTLDAIASNPALDVTKLLTSPSFQVLFSELSGGTGSGQQASNASQSSSGLNGSSASSDSIGGSVESYSAQGSNSASGAAGTNSAGNTTNTTSASTASDAQQYFRKLLGELDSIQQTNASLSSTLTGLLSGSGGGGTLVANA